MHDDRRPRSEPLGPDGVSPADSAPQRLRPRAKAAGGAPRVAYFAVGNLHKVSAGLDRVVQLHWSELAGSGIDIAGYVVEPQAGAPSVERSGATATLSTFPPSVRPAAGRRQVWMKLRSLLRPTALLTGLSLRSAAMPARVRLASGGRRPAVMVIDHLYAVQNIPLRWLLSRRGRVVFVAHDHTPLLMRDLYQDKKSLTGRIAFAADLLKSFVLENLMMRRADRVVFLSDHDRSAYPAHAGKSTALLPVAAEAEAAQAPALRDAEARAAPYVIFVGSPDFLPNRYALDWICGKLSPRLWEADRRCRILLVGKGTEAIRGAAANVEGRGFVSDRDLEKLLLESVGLLSPIEHGSGLKIKILDALAQGVPVIATRRALQGFGAFSMPLVIDVAQPGAAAAAIARLAGGAGEQDAIRATLRREMAAYRRRRQGMLARIVAELLDEEARR